MRSHPAPLYGKASIHFESNKGKKNNIRSCLLGLSLVCEVSRLDTTCGVCSCSLVLGDTGWGRVNGLTFVGTGSSVGFAMDYPLGYVTKTALMPPMLARFTSVWMCSLRGISFGVWRCAALGSCDVWTFPVLAVKVSNARILKRNRDFLSCHRRCRCMHVSAVILVDSNVSWPWLPWPRCCLSAWRVYSFAGVFTCRPLFVAGGRSLRMCFR
jgi:hypothetical protein